MRAVCRSCVNGTCTYALLPNRINATRSPLRRAMKSPSTSLTPSSRLSVLPSCVLKSDCSIDPEISTARIRSRADTSCVTASPTRSGRASAATISTQTSAAANHLDGAPPQHHGAGLRSLPGCIGQPVEKRHVDRGLLPLVGRHQPPDQQRQRKQRKRPRPFELKHGVFGSSGGPDRPAAQARRAGPAEGYMARGSGAGPHPARTRDRHRSCRET